MSEPESGTRLLPYADQKSVWKERSTTGDSGIPAGRENKEVKQPLIRLPGRVRFDNFIYSHESSICVFQNPGIFPHVSGVLCCLWHELPVGISWSSLVRSPSSG